jgi:hypothetical protein
VLYAFDLLELDCDDIRALPLGGRKKRLAKLIGKRLTGIVLGEPPRERCRNFSPGAHARPRRHRVEAAERTLSVGAAGGWLKLKTPDSPAMIQAREAGW